jgi:tRNA-2-methylthio-N6-dimethylallyladenosine synthase
MRSHTGGTGVPREEHDHRKLEHSIFLAMKQQEAKIAARSGSVAGGLAHERSVHVVTFGCQMNQHDSEIVTGLVERAGYVVAERAETADVILFNTCCVRAHAERRLYNRVSQLRRLKARRPDLIIGVGGCVAQREKATLTERFPHVDIVFGTNAVTEIVPLLQRVERGERPIIATPDDGPAPRSRVSAPADRPRVHAWVSVMRGCDNYCSYCVVPYVRGPQRSKPPEDVVGEVRALAESGIVEITLLGQNVNSYGQDLGTDISFAQLLKLLEGIPGILRIRFTTSHPKDISRDLMVAIRDLPNVCEHLHMPVQSGSARILKLMNRGYAPEEYLRTVETLRELVPHIGLTTDVIVGFPGETHEDFEQTRSLLERVQFDGAYIFKYSSRPGTAAAEIDGKPNEREIARNHRTLLDIQKELSLKRLRELVNTTQSILPEQDDARRSGHVLGRTRGHRMASVPGCNELVGKEIDVSISHLDGWTLMGENRGKEYPC